MLKEETRIGIKKNVCNDPGAASSTTPATTTTTEGTGIVDGKVWGTHTGDLSNLVTFDDKDEWNGGRITAISMRCGPYPLAFRLQYNGVWAPINGFWSEACAPNNSWTPVHNFDDDEKIVSVEISDNWWLDSVTLTTNKRTLETCGIPNAAHINVETGKRLAYISGQYGCFFDHLQFHWVS